MKELTVAARLENSETVTAFVDLFLKEIGCPLKTQIKLDIAADEIFSNISRCAYPEREGTVTICMEHKDGTVELVFRDGGIPYDPVSAVPPDLSLSADDRPIGGLGIHIVKKMMDSVSYRYENGQNILTLRKKL